jgi:hypothetical protein
MLMRRFWGLLDEWSEAKEPLVFWYRHSGELELGSNTAFSLALNGGGKGKKRIRAPYRVTHI